MLIVSSQLCLKYVAGSKQNRRVIKGTHSQEDVTASGRKNPNKKGLDNRRFMTEDIRSTWDETEVNVCHESARNQRRETNRKAKHEAPSTPKQKKTRSQDKQS